MSTTTPPAVRPRSVGRVATRFATLPTVARRVATSPLVSALTAPHTPSTYLELVNPLWSVDERRAAVVAVRRETDDATTLVLRPTRWSGHLPGQWVSLGVDVDGVRRTRCYSIASSAARTDGLVELTVRRHPGGLVSGHLNERIAPGDVVALSDPAGELVLPEERPDRLLLVSGGSGITPLMSMLRTLADEGHRGSVTFLHYARRADAVIFRAELETLRQRLPGLDLHVVLTREGDPTAPLQGHVSRGHLDAVAPDRAGLATYVCGPGALVEAVTQLHAEEAAPGPLLTERFDPPRLEPSAAEAGGTIRFTASGTDVVSDGRTLLEQAEDAGLRPASGCRMGICHTCVRRKPAGATRDVRTGAVSSADGEDVQLCVSVPVGDVSIDL